MDGSPTIVYGIIQSGGRDITKPLNLNRISSRLSEVSLARLAELDRLRTEARRDLFDRIDATQFPSDAVLTGWLVTDDDLIWVGS